MDKLMMKEKVLDFWFSKLSPQDWYAKNEDLDKKISNLFLETYYQAIRGELFIWRDSIEGRLAEIIVLDQFSRNIFRNDSRSFLYDCLALALAQEANSKLEVINLTQEQKAFLYMPYMHSESIIIHEEAVRLFTNAGLAQNLEFELKHKKIIEKFGRYPHRNELLGRASTAEEIIFLKMPDSSF